MVKTTAITEQFSGGKEVLGVDSVCMSSMLCDPYNNSQYKILAVYIFKDAPSFFSFKGRKEAIECLTTVKKNYYLKFIYF